jgi:integrase
MTRRRGSSEDSVYRDGDRWRGAVSLGYDEHGNRVRKKVSGRTRAEVTEKLRKLHQQVDSGVVPDDRLTVRAFLDRWLTVNLPGSVAESTEDDYVDTVRLHLVPALGRKPLAKLTVADLDRLWKAKRDAGYSSNSVRIMRTVLRRALGQAVREGIVARNVAGLSAAPRIRVKDGRTLTVDQDRDASSGRRTRLVVSELKTPKSRRTLSLTPELVARFRQHRARQAEPQMAAGTLWQDYGLIFASEAGTPMDPDNFSHAFARLCERAGLGHWHPHELRHSGASLMLAQGTPLHVVSEVLGHASIAITKDVYGHLLEGDKRAAAESMSRALFGG